MGTSNEDLPGKQKFNAVYKHSMVRLIYEIIMLCEFDTHSLCDRYQRVVVNVTVLQVLTGAPGRR